MPRCFAAPLLLAAAAAAQAAPEQITVGSLTLTRCGSQPSYCTRVDRPLDPLGQVPGSVKLLVEYQPHGDASQPSAGLLVAVEGGPGYPSTGSGDAYRQMYGSLLRTRDLLIMDARGSGRSGVIDCPPAQQADLLTEQLAARCGRQLGAGAHLYSSRYAADDLAAVLDLLAAPRIDLYGDSYGTYFSQTFAHRHGAWLRSLVLDSAYPVAPAAGDSAWFPTFAPTMRQTYNTVCARSPACAAQPGDAMSRIQPVLDALRAAPFTATVRDSEGTRRTFEANAARLAGTLFPGQMPYGVARELDAAARAFTAGDRLPLLRLMADAPRTEDPRDTGRDPRYYSVGLFTAVTCQDYAQVFDMRLPPAQRRAQRDTAVAELERSNPGMYAPFTVAEYRAGVPQDYSGLDTCVAWPTTPPERPVGPSIPAGATLAPGVPVLIINGELDTVTTPPEGAMVAAQFPRAHYAIKANSFHITAVPQWMADPCGANVVRQFIRTLTPGDTRCLAAVAPIRLLPGFYRQSRDVPPVRPLPGNQASAALLRLAATALWTVGDATGRVEAIGTTGVGLRGGTLTRTRTQGQRLLRLSALRWAEDVAVTGLVQTPLHAGAATAVVQVHSDAGPRGQLRITWNEGPTLAQAHLSGVLDGQRVQAVGPAP